MYRTGDWSVVELVKYLASIRKELTPDEMARLSQTRAFLAEVAPPTYGAEKNPIDSKQSSASTNQVRNLASELYEPTDSNRALGLPVLEWRSQQRWRNNSSEGMVS
jgi:Protein of unknown function (DUF3684)